MKAVAPIEHLAVAPVPTPVVLRPAARARPSYTCAKPATVHCVDLYGIEVVGIEFAYVELVFDGEPGT